MYFISKVLYNPPHIGVYLYISLSKSFHRNNSRHNRQLCANEHKLLNELFNKIFNCLYETLLIIPLKELQNKLNYYIQVLSFLNFMHI